MSQKSNFFIFQTSLLNEWFGLSWAGRNTMTNNLSKSTYRLKKKKLVSSIICQSQVILEQSAPAVLLWMDNFCEVYSKGYGFNSTVAGKKKSWIHG